MKLSFVVPAYNEEKLIDFCLAAIRESIAANRKFNFSNEIIVVDNNSTDRTADIARKAGATVVFEPVNQISRARNAGAAAATGEWLVFIDADSELNPGLLTDVLALIGTKDHVGCGSVFTMSDVPKWGRPFLNIWARISVSFNLAAGSFLMCNAPAFRLLGGFSEELYVAEEVEFSQRLKKLGSRNKLRFTVLKDHPLQTSNRKFVLYSRWELLRHMVNLSLRPKKGIRDKKYLDVWYDGRR
jgi:glycosyltransferase involved in cell wall biosynthesis